MPMHAQVDELIVNTSIISGQVDCTNIRTYRTRESGCHADKHQNFNHALKKSRIYGVFSSEAEEYISCFGDISDNYVCREDLL